jgi:Zinc finger, C2H2 type
MPAQLDYVEDSEEEDYDEDSDDDIDAEAQEMARRLGQELWADISRTTAVQPTEPTSDSTTVDSGNPSTTTGKSDAAVMTMKSILAFVENDPLARSTLLSSLVPTSDGGNVLDALQHAVTSGIIQKSIAMPLSQVIVSLARSEVLFGALRHSNASSIQLDKGKRKYEEIDGGHHSNDSRAHKRQYVPSADLQTRVTEAVRIITQAFGSSSSQPLDPSLVSSIRLQLHQVFLFAVTSSAGGGPDMHALQEISGLIQVVGVLSGIQIGQTPDTHSQNPPPVSAPDPTYPWLPSPSLTDIGTAVYPCLIAGCRKTFSRLYSLRAHQRIHSLHRPFHCKICPASFARNHDLKRHVRLHDKKAWKCGGCLKVFSRRDAIKRHKNGSKARGSKGGDCVDAQVLEVETHTEYSEEVMREERRAKLWNGIATSKATAPSYLGYHDGTQVEEGEIEPSVISSIQSAIISLHGLLQTHVGNALGSPIGQAAAPPMDPSGSQATLASVIARAQLQNLPPEVNPTPSAVDHLDSGASQSAGAHVMSPAETSMNIDNHIATTSIPSLSMYGLSDEQTKMLEEAIANAAAAAQAQAEAEAAFEEEGEYDEDQDEEDSDGDEGE